MNMKIILTIIPGLMIMAFAGLFYLGRISQSGDARGLVEAKLAKCPEKPNCICTEFPSDISHYMTPIDLSQTGLRDVRVKLKTVVDKTGGSIRAEDDNYLVATFTSSIFGFVDDLEFRIDADQKLIQLRSASRVGYSDRGVNRKRVAQIKMLFNQ